MNKPAALLALLLVALPVVAEQATPAQPLLIDVRTAAEYQTGHARAAINIPYEAIAERIATLTPDRNTHIVLYCRTGRRSGIAEQTLRQMGYQQVENRGGLSDLIRDGYPLQ